MLRVSLLFVFIVIAACDIPSRKTAAFSYIDIEEMKMVNGSSNFTDAWVFVNGQSQGVYEIPRRIPIVNEGETQVAIQAGIRENGINSAPRVYPFVTNYEFELVADEGEEIDITPIFEYVSNTNFRLDANFEIQNEFTFNEDGNNSIEIHLTSEGEGFISLRPGELLEAGSALVYNELPRDGSPIYLEIEYRGNLDLDVGLIGISGGQIFKDYFVSLRSEMQWKKAYINFTDLVIASNLDGYQVLLGADNSGGSSEARIYVDNIKLLHF